MNGAILGMRKAEIDRKFDEIVAFSEIEDFLDTPVKRYSSGMYVRLAFAVAAHLEPEILIVDEVLAVGDYAFQKKCLGKMHDVATGDGRTILFVSHNMGALAQLCDRGILLEKGSVTMIGPIQEVIKQYLESGGPGTERARPSSPSSQTSPASGSRRRCCTRTATPGRISVATSRSRFRLRFEIRKPVSSTFRPLLPVDNRGDPGPVLRLPRRRRDDRRSAGLGRAHLRDPDPGPAAGADGPTRSTWPPTGNSAIERGNYHFDDRAHAAEFTVRDLGHAWQNRPGVLGILAARGSIDRQDKTMEAGAAR